MKVVSLSLTIERRVLYYKKYTLISSFAKPKELIVIVVGRYRTIFENLFTTTRTILYMTSLFLDGSKPTIKSSEISYYGLLGFGSSCKRP